MLTALLRPPKIMRYLGGRPKKHALIGFSYGKKTMKFKENFREFSLIALGILVVLAPFVVGNTFSGWANVVLGAGVALVGAWPLFPKGKQEGEQEQA